MNFQKVCFLYLFSISLLTANAQKEGLKSITVTDLQSHLYFLAADELQGRATGEPGNEIAANYLASQVKKTGLKAMDENNDFAQEYFIEENSYDLANSFISISYPDKDTAFVKKVFYLLAPPATEDIDLSGEVVFAGYGVNSEKYNYNDFSQVDIKDKIVLIMNRAPMDESGKNPRFDDMNWNDDMNFNYKYPYISTLMPKAILMVFDPKSGYQSLEEFNPVFPGYLMSSKKLKDVEDPYAFYYNLATKIIIIHRDVAEKLLEGTGTDLKTLQNLIDDSLEPHSFPITQKTVNIHLQLNRRDITARNIFGVIEGSDPVLKNEYLIYMAHYDHVNHDPSGDVYNGADDNASGSTALLEIAEAFLGEKNKTKRSIGFLWVSAEEVGLFGSQYYTENPIIPLNQTCAVINLDMIGRSRTPRDTGKVMGDVVNVMGTDTIGVIGGLQSKIIMDINKQTLTQMNMFGDYTYNDPNHPEMFFYRSDQINFVRHDIPELFYSTGTHSDYHQPTDSPDRIDYDKLKQVSDFVFMVGYNIANYKGKIVVDNPFSKWGRE